MNDDVRQRVSAIPDYVDRETIDTLERLLRAAHAGDVTGIAYVALGKNTFLEEGATGTCLFDPVAALGSVGLLYDHVRDLARGSLGPPVPPDAV